MKQIFSGEAPTEVKLARAPLTRVICQVRFPPNLALAEASEVTGFQRAIRSDYPMLSRIDTTDISVGPAGEMRATPAVVWKFSDAQNQWDVAVSTQFVALETRAYQDRADFLRRLSTVLPAAHEAFAPRLGTRVGLRYINRLSGEALSKLPALVRQEVLGLCSLPMDSGVRLSVTESQLDLPDGNSKILLRCGLLPGMASYDPNAVEPRADASWLLDIDASRDGVEVFDPARLLNTVRQFSDHIYRLFRWVVKDEFLKEYGT